MTDFVPAGYIFKRMIFKETAGNEAFLDLGSTDGDNNIFSGELSYADYGKLTEDTNKHLFNRAIAGEYPSGSTIKPIFAAAVGGISEVYDDCVEGRFIPLYDAQIAARLILEWLDSETILEQAGTAARTRFLASFEETHVADKLTEFLKSLL